MKRRSLPAQLRWVSIGVALLIWAGLALAGDPATQPSPELKALERKVSLKLAHLRDEGPTDPGLRAQLHDAQQLDMDAEKALAAGDYNTAEDKLVKANAVLGRIGM